MTSAASDEQMLAAHVQPPPPPLVEESKAASPTSSSDATGKAARSAVAVGPVLEKLFELYPHLFGAHFLPLKLGIFQELLAAHPKQFARDELKAALGVHTRSTRYLQSVASGLPRHDLQGQPGEPVAPEHIYLSIIEIFRRRQLRSKEDLTAKLRGQLLAAFEASGLTRQVYLERIEASRADIHPALDEALQAHAQKQARLEALQKAFEASGKSAAEFGDMYGLSATETARLKPLQSAVPQAEQALVSP
jgi:ProP effector